MRRSRCSRSESGSIVATKTFKAGRWKTFADDGTDIAAAMESVKLAMKSKGMHRDSSPMDPKDQMSLLEKDANHSFMEEVPDEKAQEAQRLAQLEADQAKANAKLKSSMQKRSLKALQKAIDNAIALGVSSSTLREAQCLLSLESRLQSAVAAASLDKIRKVVTEVERGIALASFPRTPPFALHQPLQYWSERKHDWVDCHVTDVVVEGKIQISLRKKASVWYCLDEQREKFRIPHADLDLLAVAPLVRLGDARVLLDKADLLEAALLSEDLEKINEAVTQAGSDKSLAALVSRAQTFVQEVVKARAEAEAARRSAVAGAWHVAKKNLQAALRAASKSPKGASSQDGGTGWDDLEKDLVMERLTALEKAFNSTDFVCLEQAFKQLVDEGHEIPPAVIEEAGNALNLIKRQHDELEEAICAGDVDAMSAAIELASEHFLPESLIRKAKSVMETATSIQRAIKSRDAVLLANTMSQVERDFPCISIVQHGCSIVHATTKLQDALASDSIDEVRMSMELVEEHFLPERLVCNAQLAIALDKALQSEDAALLASLLSQAGQQSAEIPIAGRARDFLHVAEALQRAMQRDDLSTINAAISLAESKGFSAHAGSLLASAHGIVEASKSLEMALLSADADVISGALEVAKTHCVPRTLVEKAEQTLQKRLADSVQAAIEGGDINAIEKALQKAEARGVAQILLDKFREELKEQKAKKVTEAFHAAMQSDDTDAIEEAIRVAEAQGLPEMLIQKFRQELQEQNARKAADAVQAALQHNDAGAIEEAIRLAEAQGLPETHIRKFRQNLEDLRVKEATERLQAAMHGSDVDAIEEALRLGESQGVPSELIERFRRELDEQREQKKAQERRERFFAELQKVLKSDSIPDMRGAIAEGEALGLDSELEPARKAIEEELQRRMAKALEERQAQEKLAGEFKSAKEAQDFGGVVLVAQWRAAVAEVAKPFAFSEE